MCTSGCQNSWTTLKLGEYHQKSRPIILAIPPPPPPSIWPVQALEHAQTIDLPLLQTHSMDFQLLPINECDSLMLMIRSTRPSPSISYATMSTLHIQLGYKGKDKERL